MVCKDCRNVETVDAAVGDDVVIVETIDRGVGDGIIDPDWVLKYVANNDQNNSDSPDSKQSRSKRAAVRKTKTPNKQNKLTLKITLNANNSSSCVVNSNLSRTGSSPKKSGYQSLSEGKPSTRSGLRRKSCQKIKPNSDSESEREPNSPDEGPGSDSESEAEPSNEFAPEREPSPSPLKRKTFQDADEEEVPEFKKKRIQTFVKEECKLCGRLFRKHYMESHMRSHSKEKPHCCEKCGKKFADLNYFKYHQQQCIENPSAFQCRICQRNMASKRSLEEHVKTHSTECSFQCHVCAKVFKQGANLANHLKIHSDQTPFVCDMCGKGYRIKRSMERHRLRFHQGIRESFQCEMCDKKFACKLNLQAHLDKHLGITRYKCEHCEKRFSTKQVLKIHTRIHEGKKPFACKECGKEFRQLTVLKRHLTTHSGIKPFRCEACGKQFIHRVYMQRHKCPAQTALSNTEKNETHVSERQIADGAIHSENPFYESALGNVANMSNLMII